MPRVAHIQPIATGGRPPEAGYIHHSQLLQRSVFGVQCSVFIPLQRSVFGVQCSVFIPLQRSVFGVQCSVFSHPHHSDPEPNWYIYHSDHLGSSAFLTDAAGDPTQHLQYMPFGESFIEQRSITSYYTPYTFSAKERDTETGYSYFGARYYDADISVWLSVDPMAYERSWVSPYNYCQWKPLVLVDPTGALDGWYEDENGNAIFNKEINSQQDLIDNGIQGTYVGQTASIYCQRTNSALMGDANGNLTETTLSHSVIRGSSKSFWNYASEVMGGLFKSDPNKRLLGKAWQITSRFTWELPQTLTGIATAFLFSHKNNKVSQHKGITFIESPSFPGGGVSLGNYIFTGQSPEQSLLEHEYGHTKQSRVLGPLYLPLVGLPSVLWATLYSKSSAVRKRFDYDDFPIERNATNLGKKHY